MLPEFFSFINYKVTMNYLLLLLLLCVDNLFYVYEQNCNESIKGQYS